MNNFVQTIKWFKELKEDGVTEDEILDILEFDSDEYPDFEMLKLAKQVVYGKVTK